MRSKRWINNGNCLSLSDPESSQGAHETLRTHSKFQQPRRSTPSPPSWSGCCTSIRYSDRHSGHTSPVPSTYKLCQRQSLSATHNPKSQIMACDPLPLVHRQTSASLALRANLPRARLLRPHLTTRTAERRVLVLLNLRTIPLEYLLPTRLQDGVSLTIG
jgi:hypothetical protein